MGNTLSRTLKTSFLLILDGEKLIPKLIPASDIPNRDLVKRWELMTVDIYVMAYFLNVSSDEIFYLCRRIYSDVFLSSWKIAKKADLEEKHGNEIAKAIAVLKGMRDSSGGFVNSLPRFLLTLPENPGKEELGEEYRIRMERLGQVGWNEATSVVVEPQKGSYDGETRFFWGFYLHISADHVMLVNLMTHSFKYTELQALIRMIMAELYYWSKVWKEGDAPDCKKVHQIYLCLIHLMSGEDVPVPKGVDSELFEGVKGVRDPASFSVPRQETENPMVKMRVQNLEKHLKRLVDEAVLAARINRL